MDFTTIKPLPAPIKRWPYAATLLLFCLMLIGWAGCTAEKEHTPADWTMDWAAITDSNIQVYYHQFNMLHYPTEEWMTESSIPAPPVETMHRLPHRQRQLLDQLINDSTNFSEGDCGTFHLNAVILAVQHDTLRGLIDLGCGFHQLYFKPRNSQSKWGSLNRKGTAIFRDFLLAN